MPPESSVEIDQRGFSWSPGTTFSQCIPALFLIPGDPKAPKSLCPVSEDLDEPPKCYMEPTRDDHSDLIYSQLNVPVPVSWDYT